LNINISAANSIIKAKGVGDIKFNFRFQILILHNALYAPDIKINAISTQCLIQDNGVGYILWPHRLFNIDTTATIIEADSSSGLPIIDLNRKINSNIQLHYYEAKPQRISLELAHRRLGHISSDQVRRLVNGRFHDIELKSNSLAHKCDDCMKGQMKSRPFPNQLTLVRSRRSFEFLHIDLLQGSCEVLSSHFNYLFVIVDDLTRFG
jgi:hypothetical protein